MSRVQILTSVHNCYITDETLGFIKMTVCLLWRVLNLQQQEGMVAMPENIMFEYHVFVISYHLTQSCKVFEQNMDKLMPYSYFHTLSTDVNSIT
jgi:hypothetical protein